ncbi:hybrid sensor histidine kinase/response regulator transcription factor [Spirosoma agri]|uniref:histidine kinase n=1 Tax=Spirosoma agri TaxID=1987381 RepID=A0A6M0IIL2_9BACT|nr:two-component regulator propeller domain-containing protein [Spirosoma agri]NEU68126.1 response regulator [Spirosoma agri]
MRRRSSYLSSVLLFVILSQTGWAAIPGPEFLTMQDGLPQGFIKSMLQDRRGFVWLATRDGLCRYDGIRYKVYHHDPHNAGSPSFSSIYEIREDRQGSLWTRTENNNVDQFNPITEQARRVSDSPDFRTIVNRNQLTAIYPDQRGNVWVATLTNGFFRLNADGKITHRNWAIRNDTVQHRIDAMLVDRHGYLWLATTDGLHRYDPKARQFTVFRTVNGLPRNDVRALHERKNGELMLGFPGLFAFFNPNGGIVRQVVALPEQPLAAPLFTGDRLGNDYVNLNRYTDKTGLTPLPIPTGSPATNRPPLSMLVDQSNVLWIGTNGYGVVKYNLNKQLFQGVPYAINFQIDWINQQLGVPITDIPVDVRRQDPIALRYQFDRQKNLWIGGPRNPVYRYNTVQQTFEPVLPTGIEARWLPGGVFRLSTLTTGPVGELWGIVGTDARAVVRYDQANRSFTAFPLPLPARHPYEIMAMTVDGGRIYLATQNHGLLRADLANKRLISWRADPNDTNALPINSLLSLAQDPAHYNFLWIGTYGNGLCRLDKHTGKIRSFTVRDGLPNNVIYGIRPDTDGHLWLSTNRGLCRFDTRTFEVRDYTTDDGLPGDEFNRFHDIALPDGRIIFGGTSGYTAFYPRRVIDDKFKPIVALTALRINNQPVSVTDPDSPLRQDINATREIVLNHRQNFLSFDFAALQFNHSGKNQYRYKLTGLDKDWVYNGNQASATYTNLPPATYSFVVNASNTSGVWSPNTHQIRIVIKPAPWATWWAYTIYALLLLGAIVAFIRIRINRVRLQSRMELREQESIQLKNIDEIKSRFFSNITHEFRTPLTLILTPLDQLLKEVSDPRHHNRLAMVHRNASQLLRLINELLDLAKLETGSLTVTPSQGDLAEFLERTVSTFEEAAQRKDIRLRVYYQLAQRLYWFDTDKVEKIINNLLANALKFTDRAGSIDVDFFTFSVPNPYPSSNLPAQNDMLRIIIRDTGIGIPEHKLSFIFNRFYQVNQAEKPELVGSGIGLALVKELVDIMQGTIKVDSKPGQGSRFTIELPCQPVHAPETTPNVNEPNADQSSDLLVASPFDVTSPADLPHLLLVEDNDDIAEFVTDILRADWHVQRASNGRQGVEAALTYGPDLVISDVLMPELDGYELCRQLKSNPITNHIPILLLTAKSSIESRVEGLAAGADDYLAKPFQVDELRWRVRNRLEQQRRFSQHFRARLLSEGHVPSVSTTPEDDFMNKVYAVLNDRLGDTTFGVEPLAVAVNMSRMHLNRKVKALTGLSPIELIRAVRLNKASEMLLTNVPISDVAYAVGFDTPAYFSKVFKEHHGLTPSEYVEQNRQKLKQV